MKKSGFLTKVFFGLNSVVALLLVISFILPYLPPKSFPTISLLSLAVSPLLLVNIIFVLYWLVRRKKKVLLSLTVLLLAFFFFNPFIEFSSEGDPDKFENTLSILSYNVRLFNAYEKNPSKDVSKVISELLEKNRPDIVCIQEYYRDSIFRFSEYPYQYVHFKTTVNRRGLKKEHVLGHAILSKYPLINKGAFDFNRTSNNSIYADVVKGNDTIRIYNLHLESLRISPTVSFLQEVDKEKILKRLSKGFISQQEHIAKILAHKESAPHPVLLCGDFNNTPFSYVYRKIEKGMKDAFVERGNGLGTTYLFDSYPMRIDYVFASEELEVLKFETIKRTFSDHYPVNAVVGISKIEETRED